MKKLILTAALGVACVSAFAQGTLNFANVAAGGLNSPVWLLGVGAPNAKPAGTDYIVQLWYGAVGSTEAQLQPLAATGFFNSGAQSGYFTAGARTIDGFAGNTQVALQVRAWSAAAGATWASALTSAASNPNFVLGSSSLFNITLAQTPATPTTLLGLQPFALVPVPEPSTFALAGLGAAALMIFRRRK